MKKQREVIMKCVCLECKDEVKAMLKMNFNEKLAGAAFDCEWCDKQLVKFQKYAQFFVLK